MNRLHRKLNSFGVLLLTLSCLSPVFSIYGVGSDERRAGGWAPKLSVEKVELYAGAQEISTAG